MKIKIYNILFFVFGLSTMFIFSFCKSDCAPLPDEIFNLSTFDKAEVPYKGYDTLKFLHNGTDTIVFIGGSQSQYYTTIVPSGETDCPPAHQKLEGYNIVYSSYSFPKNIFFSQHVVEAGISAITVDFNDSKFGYSSIDIRFAKDTIKILNQEYYGKCNFNTFGSKTDTLYFNKSLGILKISTLTDKWEIIKP